MRELTPAERAYAARVLTELHRQGKLFLPTGMSADDIIVQANPE